MRLNIEWMAPWRFGKPIKNWLFRRHGRTGMTVFGIWLLGFYVSFSDRAATHGIGVSIMV